MKDSHIPTAILICLFLISCEKGEGIYSAKEKIIHVYSQTSGWFMNYNNESGTWEKVSYDDARYCSEEWTWDHRRLASIKYTERNGSSAGLDQFTYNGGLIVEKKNSSRGHRTVYTYVDNELTNIQWYVNHTLLASTNLKHSNGHITEASTKYYATAKSTSHARLLPEEVLTFAPYSAYLTQKAARTKASGPEELFNERVVIEWDNDLVTLVRSYYGDDINAEWSFCYDTKKNPLQNFWTKDQITAASIPLFGSQNNLTNYTMTADGATIESCEFSYVYDGDYPVKRVCTKEILDNQHGSGETITTEYVYK